MLVGKDLPVSPTEGTSVLSAREVSAAGAGRQTDLDRRMDSRPGIRILIKASTVVSAKIRVLSLSLLLSLLGLSVWSSGGYADESGVVSGPANADAALSTGESLEKERRWLDAIQHYDASLEKFPEDKPLTYALRRARIHHGIERRYSDRSFEEMLTRSGKAELLNQWEEVYRQVQREYLEPITATRFTSHGTESLYMALKNDEFLKRNLPNRDDEAVNRVRQTLIAEYWNRPVESVAGARNLINAVCELCRRETQLAPSAVILEYVFGGCNSLDDYSNLLTPDRYNDLYGSIQGELVGIGIEMKAVKGRGMQLVNVLLSSPAEEGGLKPEDFIVAVDGRDCRDMTTDEAAKLLRGTVGSRVALTYENTAGKEQTGEFIRRRVQIRSITRNVMLDPVQGIGYIRMEGFQDDTAQELDEALRSLERQGMRALVWDLRGNPGGLLDTAAAVVERFIDQGVLVSTKGRSEGQNQVYRAHGQYARKYPLALIVDQNSASASEIVAGAIRDHERGVIVGRKTYGKWSVQTIVRMPGDSGMAIRLTTARFYSPDDRNYSGKGLEPDVMVPQGETSQVTFFRNRTSDEINADPDVVQAVEALETRMSQK